METATNESQVMSLNQPIDSMIAPYKVVLLDADGEISQIILFLGERAESESKESLDEWLDDDMKEIPNKVYSSQSIHKDDSIRIIKKKIIKEMEAQASNIAYDEIYLFGKIKDYVSLTQLYENITENGEEPISRTTIAQLLVNFSIPDLANLIRTKLVAKEKGSLYEKSAYSYDDIKRLDIFDKTIDVEIPIGFQFVKRRNELFSTNPYHINGGFQLVQPMDTENPLVSLDNQLLLNYGQLLNNTFYLCLAKNTFDYAIQANISQEYIAKTYYPLLASRDITSEPELMEARPQLIRDTEKIMTPGSFQLYKQIDMMYSIYFQRKSGADFNYLSRGIRKFTISFISSAKILFPLHILFQNIHASLQIPFIKYSPDTKKENMYRLYCDRISKNGRKIPYLPDATIMKWSREIGKGRKGLVSFCVRMDTDSQKYELFLEMGRSGNLRISGEFLSAIGEEELSEIIRTTINPVISNINTILRPTGYAIEEFTDLRQKTVEILSMNYEWKINIDKKFDLVNYRGCLSGIFDLTELNDGSTMEGITTRFKRVENFREMDAQVAFINELFQQGADKDDIITQLVANYGLTEETAILRLAEFMTNTAELNGKIMEHPGFPVLFQIPSGKTLVIRVDNILSLEYVDVLSIYMDSILRITQLPKSIPSDITEKINMCKKSKIIVKDVTHIENVMVPIVLEKPAAIQPLTFGVEELGEEEEEDFQRFLDFNADEEEEEDEEEFEGGKTRMRAGAETPSSSPEQFEGVVEGMPLRKPNPFESRLKRFDPVLFTTKLNGKYENYSQLCNSNINRQPVVLTDQEKEEIDRVSPGSYERAIRYGSDENHQNWYICPRYWCLKTNMSMTAEDVQQGKCAKVQKPGAPAGVYYPDEIIPENDPLTNKPLTKVPKGKYVYEFKSQKEHIDKDGNYIPHYPGFLEEGIHPKGNCLPCCFKKLAQFRKNKETGEMIPVNEQAIRQTKCTVDSTNAAAITKKKKTTVKEAAIDYIKNAVFFPLEENRFGYLPIAMQLFLQVDANQFINKNNPAIIEEKKAALLRMGVEPSENQSFIAAIANIYSHLFQKPTTTIAEMREKIAKAVTLDHFVKYHSGSLISTFRPKVIQQGEYSLDDYENTDFIKRMDAKEEDYYELMIETVASYENFQRFLKDEASFIDYTHLWDILTDRNPALFNTGLNVVILESANHDITDNIHLICPTNTYSTNIYDPKKPTIILIKQQNYYEPVYVYYYENIDTRVKKILSGTFLKDSTPQTNDIHNAKSYIRELTTKVNRVLEIIRTATTKYCSPKSSRPGVYSFKRNIPVEELYSILIANSYRVDKQVLNYQRKVIGLVVSKPEIKLTNERVPLEGQFVPCFPSGILHKGDARFLNTPLFSKDLESSIMDEDDLWKNVTLTIAGLNAIKRDTKEKVLCAPHSKVIEDNLVVGILTETNQFLQVDPPSPPLEEDGYPVIRSSNYITAEWDLATNKPEEVTAAAEKQRFQKVKEIAMESAFFTAFRQIIRRFLVNDIHTSFRLDDRDIRSNINAVLHNIHFTYKARLQKIADILRSAIRGRVQFCEIDPTAMESLVHIGDLYSNIHTDIENKTEGICLVSEEKPDKKAIHFPKKNLITGTDNETAYFMRVADEIIRNKRIQNYLLNPNSFLDMNGTNFSVNADELILLQSLLTYEYFEGLVPRRENKYIETMNYNNAEPLTSQTYSNEISLEEQYNMNRVDITPEQQQYEAESIENPDPLKQAVIGNVNIRDNIWNRNAFPIDAKELIIKREVAATFYPMIYILYKTTGIWHTVTEIRRQLVEAYSRYMDLYSSKIFDIWKSQGKWRFVKSMKTAWQDVILGEEYGFSNLDLWVMCDAYHLPVVLFSSTKNKLVNLGIPPTSDWVLLYWSKESLKKNHFFIRGIGTKEVRAISSFHLIKPSISIDTMKDFSRQVRNALLTPDSQEYAEHMVSLETHLANYVVKEMKVIHVET